MADSELVIALAGNPNTGKSTIFNALTGLRQHTGNWPGKTVLQAVGYFRHRERDIKVVDLPGTYSLLADSPEEEIARDFICLEQPDAVVVVVDATALERNLALVLQISQITDRTVVCLNLMDEAKRRRMEIDVDTLARKLGVPVIPTTAITGDGLPSLKDAIWETAIRPWSNGTPWAGENWLKAAVVDDTASAIFAKAEAIAAEAFQGRPEPHRFTERLDAVITSKLWGYPIMLGLLLAALWITIQGADYPSEFLAQIFFRLENVLNAGCSHVSCPSWLHGALIEGAFRGLVWVVAVMLPPMAIFFPLFTYLEDFGFLPRIAFNLDHLFRRVGAHGKQALTMAMGFGCNAAGVIAARIINAPRERLVAILTNSFVPCNGRFPFLISMGAVLANFVAPPNTGGLLTAALVTFALFLSLTATFLVSRFLTATLLRGEPSFFVLELPPYRRPKLRGVLVRSFLERTLPVLLRAICVAAPAGLITWVLANVFVGDVTLISRLAGFFDPLGRLMGLDGVILLAFLLGLPANEIVIPILLMGYLSEGAMVQFSGIAAIKDLLVLNGWTWLTVVNFLIFSLFHWPCATTLLTIRRETASWKWTFIAALLPTVFGLLLCICLTKTVHFFFL
jgi:ferrous iron transport protein B